MRLSIPSLHRSEWISQPASVQKHTDSNWALRLSASQTPGEKTKAASYMEKKWFHSWAGWRWGVVTLGGMEERPLFPLYDANCIQTPTHRAVSLTVKVRRDRQPARGNTLPPLLESAQKPQHLMAHAQSSQTFPSVSRFAIVRNGASRKHK